MQAGVPPVRSKRQAAAWITSVVSPAFVQTCHYDRRRSTLAAMSPMAKGVTRTSALSIGDTTRRRNTLLETALLDVRVLPWRPRARVMQADTLRENADPFVAVDDLAGVVLGLALWLAIIIAAPLIVLVLAAGLFSVELPIVVAVAVLLGAARFTGLIPWTVVIHDPITGDERRESYRSIWREVARIRGINSDRRVKVRWAWA